MGVLITIENLYENGVCDEYNIYSGTTYNINDAVSMGSHELPYEWDGGDFNGNLYVFVEHCDGHTPPPPNNTPIRQGGFQVKLITIDCEPPCNANPIIVSNTPTPTPLPTSTPQPTPVPTPTPIPCDLQITSTVTTDPTNQEGTNGTVTIEFTTTHGPTTYTLNGVPQGTCTSPLVISNLISEVEYTVIITDSNECTDQTTFTPGQTSFTFPANYIMLTYEFVDGRDLDTRTRIVTPDVGQDTQNEYLGWSCQSKWPVTSTEYLTWSGDNTGTGFESVLVNIDEFNAANPSATEIVMDLRSFWYGTVGSSPVNIAATLWEGGTPVKNGFIWTNPTATDTYNINSVGKLVTDDGSPDKATSSGERVATLTYNLITGEGVLDNNDTTTPVV